MSEDTLTFTMSDLTRWRNERQAAGSPVVTYGAWEPIFGPERTRQVATDVRGVLFPFVYAYTEVKDHPIVGHRRRRMERWFETDGRLMGRWEWEYADR